MKKAHKNVFAAIFLSVAAIFSATLFLSCQNDLISEPNMSQIMGSKSATSSSTLLAPIGITASHGRKRNVNLSWKAVTGAVSYNIYKADTLSSEPKQIDETSDNSTSITLYPNGKSDSGSGISCYFLIRSVGPSGTLSDYSSRVYGSTLGIPIITDVEQGEDGTSSTVTWWMPNCTEDTYKNNVLYEVFCFNNETATEKDLVFQSAPISADKNNKYTITGLTGNTTYYYQVKAYLKTSYSESVTDEEESEIVTKDTAHKQIPNAAENFTATKGISKDSIILSWNLPEFVDFYVNGGYTSHPIYFTLERKLISESDKKYEKIASYIGSIIPNGTTDFTLSTAQSSGKYYFDCSDTSKKTDNITISASTDDSEINYDYPNYLSGYYITFEDSSVNNTEQYSYKITSYVDDANGRLISSDSSITTSGGWLVAPISISTTAKYNDDTSDSTKYSEVDISFTASFDERELTNTYAYILEENRTPFEDSTNITSSTTQKKFESIEKINNYTRSFTDFKNEDGYYSYTLYVVPFTSVSSEDAITTAKTANQLTVTNDKTKKIEIENFKIEDGYAHKFVFTWEMNEAQISTCEYKIKYIENGTESEYKTITPNIKGNTATYEETDIPSGTSRAYTLSANNGLTDEKSSRTVYTLGKPKPNFDTSNIDYSTITVTWNKVQNGYSDESNTTELSTEYEVSAKYSDGTEELINTTDENADGYTKIENTDGKYTCTITKPTGWNKPEFSGKDITLTVKAISTERKESESDTENSNVTNDITVCTLGPAKLNTKISLMDAEKINLTWNKATGSTKYLVYRTKYTDNSAKVVAENGQTYYILSEKNNSYTIEEKNGGTTTNSTKIASTNDTITFSDIHCETDCGDSTYTQNQQQLGWGLPFGYVVLPIKDSDDFEFEDNSTTMKEGSEVDYGTLEPEIGATYGYGLNVTAAKAESMDTIGITWDAPYTNSNTTPYLYRKKYGTSDWELVKSGLSGVSTYDNTLEDKDKTKAYYYAVQYRKEDGSFDDIASYEEHLATKDTRYKNTSGKEELNKGYLFYIDFSASYNGTIDSDGNYAKDNNYYAEKVSHSIWNFTERAKGPSEYTITGWNLNNTDDAINIATISIDSTTGEETFIINANDKILNDNTSDTHIEKSGSSLILYPIGITNGNKTDTEGIMRALRSTKTIYKLEATHEYERNGISSEVEFSKEAYGYRQLTNDELARCIGLIIADGLYQMGIPAAEGIVLSAQITSNSLNGASISEGVYGSFNISHTAWQKRFQWSLSNYRHIYPNGCSSAYSSSYDSDFILSSTVSENAVGSDDNILYYMAPVTLTVTHDSGIKDLNCKVVFTAGEAGSLTLIGSGSTTLSWNLTIQKGGSSIVSVSSNQSDFLKYFPYDIGSSHKSADATVNTSLETYKNTSYTWWK